MTIQVSQSYTEIPGLEFIEIACPFEDFVVKSYLKRGQTVMNHCRFEKHDTLASGRTKVHEDTVCIAHLEAV